MLIKVSQEEYYKLLNDSVLLQNLKYFGLENSEFYSEFLKFDKEMEKYEDNYEEEDEY
jgi:hypothetical protein